MTHSNAPVSNSENIIFCYFKEGTHLYINFKFNEILYDDWGLYDDESEFFSQLVLTLI